MAWRFHKSLKIGPIRLNLSKSGIGTSIGVRGFRVGTDAKGRSYTATSIPGTGIYERKYSSQGQAAGGTRLRRPARWQGKTVARALAWGFFCWRSWLADWWSSFSRLTPYRPARDPTSGCERPCEAATAYPCEAAARSSVCCQFKARKLCGHSAPGSSSRKPSFASGRQLERIDHPFFWKPTLEQIEEQTAPARPRSSPCGNSRRVPVGEGRGW